MKVKVNNKALAGILGVKVGAVVNVKEKKGIPVDREWRNRLKDAKVDNCVTVVDQKPEVKPKKEIK